MFCSHRRRRAIAGAIMAAPAAVLVIPGPAVAEERAVVARTLAELPDAERVPLVLRTLPSARDLLTSACLACRPPSDPR